MRELKLASPTTLLDFIWEARFQVPRPGQLHMLEVNPRVS